MALHPTIARVTDRIVANSRDSRQHYLDLMEREGDARGVRQRIFVVHVERAEHAVKLMVDADRARQRVDGFMAVQQQAVDAVLGQQRGGGDAVFRGTQHSLRDVRGHSVCEGLPFRRLGPEAD